MRITYLRFPDLPETIAAEEAYTDLTAAGIFLYHEGLHCNPKLAQIYGKALQDWTKKAWAAGVAIAKIVREKRGLT